MYSDPTTRCWLGSRTAMNRGRQRIAAPSEWSISLNSFFVDHVFSEPWASASPRLFVSLGAPRGLGRRATRQRQGVAAMLLADLNHVSRIVGGRVLFEELAWSIQDGEKIGLVGPNGVGKSTLLRTLAGLEPPEAGAVTLRRGARVAYLPQEYAGEPGRGVLDELLAARDRPGRAGSAPVAPPRRAWATRRSWPTSRAFERVLAEHERLLEQFERLGGPTAAQPRRGAAARAGAGRGAVGAADGAAQRRPAQAGRPGALPAGRAGPAAARRARQPPRPGAPRRCWSSIIGEFAGAVVLISHDRYLLDETVEQIVELEPARGGARGCGAGRATTRPTRPRRSWRCSGSSRIMSPSRRRSSSWRRRSRASSSGRASSSMSATSGRRASSSARSTAWTRSSGRCWSGAGWRWQFRPHGRGGARAVELRDVSKSLRRQDRSCATSRRR